ncbi:MAG: hypothetical protein ACYDBQ_01485 [Thermoplasmatota archaeon]
MENESASAILALRTPMEEILLCGCVGLLAAGAWVSIMLTIATFVPGGGNAAPLMGVGIPAVPVMTFVVTRLWMRRRQAP